MTFIKITDPKQREALAKELQDTKRAIQASNLQHRLSNIDLDRDLTKVFKPVVEAQKAAASQITQKIEELPAPVPALPPPPEPLPIEPPMNTILGPRAQKFLKLSMTPNADYTFGLRVEGNTIMIGGLPVNFEGDDILVDGVRYKGTPGLWELMVMKRPESYDPEDLMTYGEILRASGAMYQGNSILSRTPKANRSYKWKEIVSHIYKQDKFGSGMPAVFLPNDFDPLLDRLDLCAAAYRAGNNGVRNEMVAILDAMKRLGHVDHGEYVQLHRQLL
ncbi:uncharacterized protein [Mytilus edulis]|uniref:uncharacterized protein n=1 Tax=Mytilus edulis TaxID=6550 RepID=UPI0039EECCBF